MNLATFNENEKTFKNTIELKQLSINELTVDKNNLITELNRMKSDYKALINENHAKENLTKNIISESGNEIELMKN